MAWYSSFAVFVIHLRKKCVLSLSTMPLFQQNLPMSWLWSSKLCSSTILHFIAHTHTNIPGRNHKSLEYIVVDRLKETGRYQVYRQIEILRTPDCLESFDCHKDGQEEDAKSSSFRPHHRLHLALVAHNFYCSTAKVDLLLPICIKYSPTFFEYGRFFGFDNCLNKVPI